MHHTTNPTRSRDDRGASMVEYALLLSLIVIVCLASVTFFGGENQASIGNSASEVAEAMGG